MKIIDTKHFLEEIKENEEVLHWLGVGPKEAVLKKLVVMLQDSNLEEEIIEASNILLQAIIKKITGKDYGEKLLSIRKNWKIVCDKTPCNKKIE